MATATSSEDLRLTPHGELHPFWSAKDAEESHVLLLTANQNWVVASQLVTDQDYLDQMRTVLINAKNRAPKAPTTDNNCIFTTQHYKVQVLDAQRHRFGSLVFCLQQNRTTKGCRFLVFALAYNPTGLDYGIGRAPQYFSANELQDQYKTLIMTHVTQTKEAIGWLVDVK